MFYFSSKDVISLPFLTHILLVAAKSFQYRMPSAGSREASHPRDSGNSRQSQPSTGHMAGAGKSLY